MAPRKISVSNWRCRSEVSSERTKAAIMPIPAASPSMLSRRLNALAMPTIHTTRKAEVHPSSAAQRINHSQGNGRRGNHELRRQPGTGLAGAKIVAQADDRHDRRQQGYAQQLRVQMGENANRQETEDDCDSAKLGHRLAMPAVSARLRPATPGVGRDAGCRR